VKRQGNGIKGKGTTLKRLKGAWLVVFSFADILPLFQRKREQPPATAPAPEPELPKGWLHPESATTLLATPRRQKLLEHIWQRTSLSHQQFHTLYLAPLHRYAELVQQFPASESHHHAYPGGMLDHGLEIAGNRRLRTETAPIAPAARWRSARRPVGTSRGLDSGGGLRRAAARHRQDCYGYTG